MNSPNSHATAGVVALLVVLMFGISVGRATTIDPYTVEELLTYADLVAEVECTIAGGVVAEYRVVRTYRGKPKANVVRIKSAIDYWGPQFTPAFVGERYLVAAFEAPPSRLESWSSPAYVPEWWRNLWFDYALPLGQGRCSLDENSRQRAVECGLFLGRAKEFLALNDAAREAAVLRSVAIKRFRGVRFEQDTHVRELYAAFEKETEGQQDVRVIVDRILSLESVFSDFNAMRVFAEAGGTIARDYLESLGKVVATTRASSFVIPSLGPPAPAALTGSRSDEATLERWVATLNREDQWSAEFWDAFRELSRHGPESVVKWLIEWRSRSVGWKRGQDPYTVGSVAHPVPWTVG